MHHVPFSGVLSLPRHTWLVQPHRFHHVTRVLNIKRAMAMSIEASRHPKPQLVIDRGRLRFKVVIYRGNGVLRTTVRLGYRWSPQTGESDGWYCIHPAVYALRARGRTSIVWTDGQ